jgi:acyl-coenzyme A thioesterase PaaI-like protein
MGDAGDKCALRLAATARKWLEDVRVDREGRVHPAVASGGQALTWLATAGARVSLAEPGRVVCSLRVGAPLTVRAAYPLPASACRAGAVGRRSARARVLDWIQSNPKTRAHPIQSDRPGALFLVRARMQDAEGRWHAGAIAVAADNVCAAAVFTALGADVLTVQYSLSYFSPAHLDVRAYTTHS